VPEHAFPGLVVATLYEAALDEANVGGDFFDAFALPRGRVAVAIADASGKGLAAAVRTIQLKDVLRAFTREYPHSPAAIVARLNDFVCDTHLFDDADEAFSCLTLAIVNPQTGEGSLVRPGASRHCWCGRTGRPEEMEVSGLPLGSGTASSTRRAHFGFCPATRWLLVTDGITEARRGSRQRREFLGYEGMTDLARRALGQATLPSLRDAAKAILDGARSFGGGSLSDDACIVLVRRH
jgi:serine phosphatase RsbU (regulator of sigma subunit)